MTDTLTDTLIDTSVPHSARVWNFWLGGKDNYPVDRQAGAQYRETFPDIVDLARGVREFLSRAVQFLAGEAGIGQFLDIGVGLPAVDNTHEIAQRINPQARIVYVDNDQFVLSHARALLTSRPEGEVAYIEGDLEDPDGIVEKARWELDFDAPVAVLLMHMLGAVPDLLDARLIVQRLTAALPKGSYIATSDETNTDDRHVQAARQYWDTGAAKYVLRSPQEFGELFDGVEDRLELVEPGLVTPTRWRPQPSPFALSSAVDDALCAVAVVTK